MKYKKFSYPGGNCKGAIYLELVPPDAKINVHVYCQQLERLNKVLKKKRLVLGNQKGLIFYKNARPYTAKITSQKIEVLGTKKFFYFSPDLAPCQPLLVEFVGIEISLLL